jgi:hypothetical protein
MSLPGFAPLDPATKRKNKKLKERKGSGTSADAYPFLRIISDAAACSAEHARLSAFHRGSSWRSRNISVQLIGKRSDAVLRTAMPGFLGRGMRMTKAGISNGSRARAFTAGNSARRALSAPACPSPASTSQPVIVPATDAQSRPGEVCETARGHRTRSVIRIASGIRPARSEGRHCNLNGDEYQRKSDIMRRVKQYSFL